MTNQQGASEQATKYLALPEGNIGYDIQGTGPLLVLVPGMGELRSSYRFLTTALVDAGYTVATTDLRGHGDSDTTFSSYGDLETAGDVSALIEKLGGPAVIVGNSLAAGSAVIVAADHPNQVTGLVLVGPYVRNPKMSAVQLAVFRAIMAPLWVATSWKYYMPSLYAGQKPGDFDQYRTSVIANIRRPGYAKAFSRTAKQTDHAPAEARLAAVAAPVLVIMGERDPDFKDPAAEARWIGETLHGEVVMVAEAGHYPQSQQPALVAAAVLRFLADVTNHA
jgi:pimeloyl-ACP methyl ester carboxylesterase